MSEAEAPTRRRRPWWAFAALGLLGAVFVAAAVLTFLSFQNETRLRQTPYVAGPLELGNGVVVSARALKVDPATDTATFRMTFDAVGRYADPAGALTQPLTVYVETDQGWVPKSYSKDELMRPMDSTLPLYGGFPGDYPFDSYSVDVNVAVDTDAGNSIPSALQVLASVHGFSFHLKRAANQPDGAHLVSLGLKRSLGTRFFSIFVMTVMWALALLAVALMVRLILLGRRIEFPMFTFLAALLFAFPAVRNALPGAPPLGVRLDYLSFFWCELLVALSLILMLGTWVFTRNETDPPR